MNPQWKAVVADILVVPGDSISQTLDQYRHIHPHPRIANGRTGWFHRFLFVESVAQIQGLSDLSILETVHRLEYTEGGGMKVAHLGIDMWVPYRAQADTVHLDSPNLLTHIARNHPLDGMGHEQSLSPDVQHLGPEGTAMYIPGLQPSDQGYKDGVDGS